MANTALHQVGRGHARPDRHRRHCPATATGEPGAEPTVRRDVDVEVNGKRFAVSMYVPESQLAPVAAGGGARRSHGPSAAAAGGGAAAIAGSGKIAVPMQGTIVKVLVEVGQTVAKGDAVVVLEAMKMENNVASDVDGTVTEVKASAGPVGDRRRGRRRHRARRLSALRLRSRGRPRPSVRPVSDDTTTSETPRPADAEAHVEVACIWAG